MKRQVIDCSCPPSSPWRNSPGLDAQLSAISEATTFGPLIASKRWPIDLEADAKEYRADRIEVLEAALRQIEYLDRPQVRGQPRRKTIQQIALDALGRVE